MSTDQRNPKGHSHLRGTGGYTLVEMMIAVGIAAIVGMGIYAVFNTYTKSGISSKNYNDMQTSCTFALDQMKAELLLTGYRARDSVVGPIKDPSGDTITFEYHDDNARDEGDYATGFDKTTLVTYRNDAGELKRSYQRFDRSLGNYNAAKTTTQTLAKNIAALSFEYLVSGGGAWNTGVNKDIRSIRVSLTCAAARPDPNTKKTAQITLTAEVRARNIGVAGAPADITAPPAPQGLISWDPGACGTLQLRWNGVSEPDLEGYTIFYGLQSGTYTDRVVVPRGPSSGTETYTLTGLSSAITGVSPQPQYYIVLNSYDKSGNVSTSLSNVATGNPPITLAEPTGCDDAGCAVSTTDTTPTPLVPLAPISLAATVPLGSAVPPATPVALNNSIRLTWDKSGAADLLGYRLYRSTDPDFVPNEDNNTNNNRIAKETILNQDAVSFTDSGLLGCTTYYYKLATIACDQNIPIAGMLFATTSAAPVDTVPPSSPTLIGRPGFKRIILNLTNPTRTGDDSDFLHTKIWYSSSLPYPSWNTVTKTASNGTLIPDATPYSVSTPGTFSGTGTILPPPNFNSLTNGSPGFTNPELPACYNQTNIDNGTDTICNPITYYFTAVAFDGCENSSVITSSSQSQGTQCNDCASGELCYNAPPAPTNLVASGCSSVDGLQLTWDSYDPDVYRDLAGFHIWRCEGLTCAVDGVELTEGTPIWFNHIINDNSGNYPIAEGTTYSYRIQAADCYYERRDGVTAAELLTNGNNDPYDNSASTSINNLSVGRVTLDPTMVETVSGYLLPSTAALPFTEIADDGLTSDPPNFQHNTVTFWANSTSGNSLTLKEANFSWENTSAFLKQFSFGDGDNTPVTRLGWEDTAVSPLPLTHSYAGSTMTLAADSSLLANDQRIPLVLRFQNADGGVTAATDSRQQTIEYTLTYRNDSTNTEGCGLTGSIYVPRGPYIYGTTQDQPTGGTPAWPVSSPSQKDHISVQGGTDVRVFTNVYTPGATDIVSVKLYYYADTTRADGAAPAITSQYPDFTPPYTMIEMQKDAGLQWSTPTGSKINYSDNSSIWYFIVATDIYGNFARDPDINSGTYQYFQEFANACNTTPRPPTLCTNCNVSGNTVTLTWTAPLANTNGTAYNDGQGYKIYRSKDGGTYAWLANINNKDTLTYNATMADLQTAAYSFIVFAFDQCLPTPKYSAASNTFTETAEDNCSNTPNTPTLTGTTDGSGGQVTLTWTAPATNTSGSTCTDLAGFQIWRQKGTGTNTLYVPGAGGASDLPSSTLTYTDPPTGTITDLLTEDYKYYITAFDSCTPTAKVSALSRPYIDTYTNLDPCSTTPGNVISFTGSVDTITKVVTLTWSSPTTQTDGSPYNDPGGFWIFRHKDGVNQGNIAKLPASQFSYLDSSVASDIGTSTYKYFIIAVDTCSPIKYSPISVPWTETYNLPPCETLNPGPPTSLGVSAADNGSVTLTWSDPVPNPGDIGGFIVERKMDGGSYAPVSTSPAYYPMIPANTFVDDTLNPSQGVFCYRLKSFDTCDTGANYGASYSNEACETYDPCGTAPDPPTVLDGSVANNEVTLTWTAPNASLIQNQGLSGYEVYRQTGTCGDWTKVATVANPTTVTTMDVAIPDSLWARAYTYKLLSYKACSPDNLVSATTSNEWTESNTTNPCSSSVTVPAPPSLAAAVSGTCGTTAVPVSKRTTLTWTFTGSDKTPPSGHTRSFRIYSCNGACTLTCDTLGCFTSSTKCTSASQPTVVSGPTCSGTSSVVCTAVVETPDFLKTNPYNFHVQTLYTSQSGVCKQVSSTSTVNDPCP